MSPFPLIDQSNPKERIDQLGHPDTFGAGKVDTQNLAAAEPNRTVQTSGFPILLAAVATGVLVSFGLLELYKILVFPL